MALFQPPSIDRQTDIDFGGPSVLRHTSVPYSLSIKVIEIVHSQGKTTIPSYIKQAVVAAVS